MRWEFWAVCLITLIIFSKGVVLWVVINPKYWFIDKFCCQRWQRCWHWSVSLCCDWCELLCWLKLAPPEHTGILKGNFLLLHRQSGHNIGFCRVGTAPEDPYNISHDSGEGKHYKAWGLFFFFYTFAIIMLDLFYLLIFSPHLPVCTSLTCHFSFLLKVCEWSIGTHLWVCVNVCAWVCCVVCVGGRHGYVHCSVLQQICQSSCFVLL